MKALITVIAHRGVTPETFVCWTQSLMSGEFKGLDDGSQVKIQFNDALISRSRSIVCTNALRNGFDVLAWIDADMIWQVGDLRRIIDKACETRGIVGAVVPKRAFGKGYAARPVEEGLQIEIGEDKLHPALYVGGAFQAIHRDVLEAVAKDLPECLNSDGTTFLPFCDCVTRPMESLDARRDVFPPGTQEYLSEDWALCRRAIDAGRKCWLDAKPWIEHVGPHKYNLRDACVAADGQESNAPA